jgi:hypothetical protein
LSPLLHNTFVLLKRASSTSQRERSCRPLDRSTMTNAPPPKPPKNYKKHYMCGSLLLLESAIAITIFTLSLREYTLWYRTTHHLQRTNDLIIHTTLFIATCAPLCAILGVMVGVIYYWRNRTKYGRYESSMRRQGRGYWTDPADAEEVRRWTEAKKINALQRVTASIPTTTAITTGHPMSLSGSTLHSSALSGSTLPDTTATINTLSMGTERLAQPILTAGCSRPKSPTNLAHLNQRSFGRTRSRPVITTTSRGRAFRIYGWVEWGRRATPGEMCGRRIGMRRWG